MTTILNIGKAWKSQTENGKPYLAISLNQDLPNITLSSNDKLQFWPNQKRNGINPRTGKEFRDADYSVSIVQSDPSAPVANLL